MTDPSGRSRIHAHPDYSRAVLDELYRYPLKRKTIAWPLWALTGILGGHRFYLERTGTGILMLVTGGGALVWWMIDFFLLGDMVEAYNREQKGRERVGLPPIALDFMPSTRESGRVEGRPEWADRRGGSVRLIGDALVLTVAGLALGSLTVQEGVFEALIAILALIAITNLGARWDRMARLPLLRELDRWSHRLRLFYHFNDPGGPLSLLLRPVVGLVTAFFRRRARAEVRLYLQLGGVFVILFTIVDLASAAAFSRAGIDASIDAFVEDVATTFVSVYGFATPIGATLTRHLLLERTDWVLWTLSALSLAAIAAGLYSG